MAVRQLLKLRSTRVRRARLEGLTKLELLPSEREFFLCTIGGITTVTFFTGSPATAKEHLARRVAEMTALNPWLSAMLDRDPETGMMAAYYAQEGAPRAPLFAVRRDLPLRRGMSYAAMRRVLAPVMCASSRDSVGTGSPLFRVALLPDASAPDSAFALVVSANHSLVDGHGFYSLYNMLSADARAVALEPIRKQELPVKMLEAVGGEFSSTMPASPGFIVRYSVGQLREAFFPQTKACMFKISAEWLAKQKASAARVGNMAFVSTNDCIASEFFNCAQADEGRMLINFRGRVAGCKERRGQLRGHCRLLQG